MEITLEGSVFYSFCTHWCNSGELNTNTFFCATSVEYHCSVTELTGLPSPAFLPIHIVEKQPKSWALGGSLALSGVSWELHVGLSEEHLNFMLQRMSCIVWLKVVYAEVLGNGTKKKKDVSRGRGVTIRLISLSSSRHLFLGKGSLMGSAEDSGWDTWVGMEEGKETESRFPGKSWAMSRGKGGVLQCVKESGSKEKGETNLTSQETGRFGGQLLKDRVAGN